MKKKTGLCYAFYTIHCFIVAVLSFQKISIRGWSSYVIERVRVQYASTIEFVQKEKNQLTLRK